jgi:hypothetical protein
MWILHIRLDKLKFGLHHTESINTTIIPEKCVKITPSLVHLQPQKNWTPFIYNNELHLIYSFNPFRIFKINPDTGSYIETINKVYLTLPENSSSHVCDNKFLENSSSHVCDNKFLENSSSHVCDNKFLENSSSRVCDNKFLENSSSRVPKGFPNNIRGGSNAILFGYNTYLTITHCKIGFIYTHQFILFNLNGIISISPEFIIISEENEILFLNDTNKKVLNTCQNLILNTQFVSGIIEYNNNFVKITYGELDYYSKELIIKKDDIQNKLNII